MLNWDTQLSATQAHSSTSCIKMLSNGKSRNQGAIMSDAGAGEVLKGWRVYPLQLDDLSPISFAATRGSVEAASSEGSVPQLAGPAAEEVGPIFYR